MDNSNIYDNVYIIILLCRIIQLRYRYNINNIIIWFYYMENDIHYTKLIIIFIYNTNKEVLIFNYG